MDVSRSIVYVSLNVVVCQLSMNHIHDHLCTSVVMSISINYELISIISSRLVALLIYAV